MLTIVLYSKRCGHRPIRITDMAVPGLIFAQAIGRWGNFFNQEAYGAATTLEHLRSMHIPQFVIEGMNINGIYYTPTFFYESIWCLVGCLFIYFMRKRKFTKVGDATALYLIWYSVGRFMIEASRTDSLMFLGFKVAQIVSVGMIIIGIVILSKNRKKSKYEDLYNDVNNCGVK